jgi:hypothetical protein
MATHVGCMNRCAVRSFLVNETFEGSFIFPIMEDYNWTKWSESNIIKVSLNKGMQKLSLIYTENNENMSVDENKVVLDYIKLIKI